jgi:cysteinyl-tRNA synthetase
MGIRYLGDRFDIHGGGMDLLFPHHESEIAQSVAANGQSPARYWLHNNMITLNGQKMGKSLGNAVSLFDFFAGNHPLLEKPYSPMTIRFFILQAHYRSTLDFSNEALQAAEKGLKKLFAAINAIEKLPLSDKSTSSIPELRQKCYEAMNDDFNSPIAIAHLFEGVRIINSVKDKSETLTKEDSEILKMTMYDFVFEILGLKEEEAGASGKLTEGLMKTIIAVRQKARENKDFATSDMIRDRLAELSIKIKDTKDGAEWTIGD